MPTDILAVYIFQLVFLTLEHFKHLLLSIMQEKSCVARDIVKKKPRIKMSPSKR